MPLATATEAVVEPTATPAEIPTIEPTRAVVAATSMPPVVQQPPAGPPPSVVFNVSAQNLAYNVSVLEARSGATVTVNFQNLDNGVAHDLSFNILGLGHGHTCSGPCSDGYSFTAPAAGNYLFFCTTHEGMVGSFIVAP